MARRLGDGKEQIALDTAQVTVPAALDDFQAFLLRRATEFRDTHTVVVDDWDSFGAAVRVGWARAFHCGSAECEDTIRAETAATPRCIPFDAPEESGDSDHSVHCVRCDRSAAYGKRVIFGKAY
jgi:prolyl-tRNA synthetase